MGLKLGNRTKQTWTGTGTGTLNLDADGATVTGYQSFADALVDGDTVVIAIVLEDESEVEICWSVWTEATQLLTRGTLIWSTTGSRINFSAGTKYVFVDVPAELVHGLSRDRNEPTGFPNTTDTSLAWDDAGPRKFTLTKVANFSIWTGGIRHDFTASQDVTIPDVADLYYIYCDTDGTLKSTTDPWDIAGGLAPVALVYWNGDNGRCYDERHGIQMDGRTHEYLHETRGGAYALGGGLTSATNGSTFEVLEGEWYDDDLEHVPATKTTAPMFYRDSGVWKWTAAQAAYFHSVSSVPQYDNAGTLADVDTSKYSMTWIFWTADINAPVVFVVGQGQYNTVALAEAVSPDSLVLPDGLGAESKLLYRIVWQRNGAAITKKTVTDYRRQLGQPGAYVANDHRALANLAWTSSGHTGTASKIAGFDADGNAAEKTSGTDFAPANPLATDTLWDAKGDLVGGTGANTAGKLTVGTNGKVLVAASGETTGLKWAYLPDGIREYQPTAMQPLEATAPAWEVVDFGTVVATVASFDDTAEEYLNGKFVVPASIDTAGTVTFEVTVSPKTGAASKNVAWTFGHAARATGEAIDSAYTDEDSGDKAITATTGQQTIMTWTETVSNLGWVAGDVVYFRLSRDPGAGTDLTGDCYLLMFRVLMPTVL